MYIEKKNVTIEKLQIKIKIKNETKNISDGKEKFPIKFDTIPISLCIIKSITTGLITTHQSDDSITSLVMLAWIF